jgi:Phage tail assembly chaperone proteins, E, or 41 or 14
VASTAQTPEGTITVQLKYGAEDSGATLPALTMRRPKVKDQLRAQKLSNVSDAEREVRLFADLCMVPPATIEGLDLEDYNTLQAAFQGFSKREE